MSSQLARESAAQAWCTPKTEKIEMIPELAEAFADILDKVISQPWLGNATTGELLDELRARAELSGYINYKTVGGEEIMKTRDSKQLREACWAAHQFILKYAKYFDNQSDWEIAYKVNELLAKALGEENEK